MFECGNSVTEAKQLLENLIYDGKKICCLQVWTSLQKHSQPSAKLSKIFMNFEPSLCGRHNRMNLSDKPERLSCDEDP